MGNFDSSEQKSFKGRLNNLFYQLIFSMVLLAILPLVVVAVGEYQRGKENILENQHHQLEVASQQLARQLNDYLNSVSTSLQVQSSIAEQMFLHLKQTREAQKEETAAFTQSFGYQLIIGQYRDDIDKYLQAYQLPGIAYADEGGSILYAAGDEASLTGGNLFSDSLSSTDLKRAFNKVLNSKNAALTISEKLHGQETMHRNRLLSPVLNEHNQVSGVILASLNSEKLSSFFHFDDHQLGVKAYLLTEEGSIQYGSDIAKHQFMGLQSLHPKASMQTLVVDDHSGEDIVDEYLSLNNQTVFGDIHAVEFQGTVMKVVIEVAMYKALAPINAFRARLLKMIGITLLIVFGVAYLVTRRVVSPVGKLTERIMRVRKGNYEEKEVIKGYSEVESLSRNFEYMTREIKKLLDESQVQGWYQQGNVQLNNAIIGNHRVQPLSEKILTSMARYLDFKVAAFYLANESEQLELMSSYARPRKSLAASIAFGEGLVGQAALDQSILELDNSGVEGVVIESATGSAEPQTIIAVPVTVNKKTIGVMVFAQFGNLSEKQLRFLQGCENTIGMALHSARQREALTAKE